MPSAHHPGLRLQSEYLLPLGISQNRLARELGVPPRRINEIVLGKRAISADTAVRLARFFGNDAGDWMRWQADFDIERAAASLGSRLPRIRALNADGCEIPPAAAVASTATGATIRKRILR